jgi:glycosyltransferase involved in cell wall biosynthesis
MPNVRWVYFDLPPWLSFWKRGQRGVHLYYYLWQIGAYRLARNLHAKVRFDVIHHVTFAQYQIPSFMGNLGVPFIFGPVGGGESTPWRFWPGFSIRGILFEIQRSVGRTLASFDLNVRSCIRSSRLALATTQETAYRLRKLGAPRVLVQPVFGMMQKDFAYFDSFPIRNSTPFRMISMGRLIHWKGIHLALRAFAQFHASYPDSEYWIAGEGAESDRLKRLAHKLGIERWVTFCGNLSLEETYRRLGECDILLHPALHDSSPVACIEAMTAGRPVICVAIGGPAIQVTEETGIKVPAISPRQVVNDLQAAMLRLAVDPALRFRMSEAGRKRVVTHYNWAARCEEMARFYDVLADDRATPSVTSGERQQFWQTEQLRP